MAHFAQKRLKDKEADDFPALGKAAVVLPSPQ